MPENSMQEAVKALTAFWKEVGKNVGAEETRRWIQPHVDIMTKIVADKATAELLKKIASDAFPDGQWQGVVALNQIIYLGKINEQPERAKELLQTFYEVWSKQPLNLSAFLIEWRRQSVGSKLDPTIVLSTLSYDPSKQSYFDPEISGNGVEFFLNMYKDEFGIDVDTLSDSVAKIVGEDWITDFFRLVDIDAPVSPDEFVRRVDKAVDVLATAKEQGLDVARIMRRWDALADRGGERLTKLPAAVKAVAEEAVKERFWKGFVDIAGRLKVPVIDDSTEPSEILSELHAKGLITIKGGEITFDKDLETLLSSALEILMKVNPSAIYTTSDLVNTALEILRNASGKKVAVDGAAVIAAADVATIRKIFEKNLIPDVLIAVASTVSAGGVRKEEFVEALRLALEDGSEDLAKRITAKIHEVKER